MQETAQHPTPAPDVKGTDLGDEYLFYDRDNDRVHVLNATAREIFLLCDGSRTADEIAAELASGAVPAPSGRPRSIHRDR